MADGRVGITFGDWKLIPVEPLNWQLARRSVKVVDGKERTRWNRVMRYYQYNTIADAFLFAADAEARERFGEEQIDITEYARWYEGLLDKYRNDISTYLSGKNIV